jgi:hypothetical protein
VASSDGSASPAIKARALHRRAAMGFSSRDGAGPHQGPAVERKRDLAAHTA